MGQYDFTYEVPDNFNKRVIQYLQQQGRNDLIDAFKQCTCEYEDVGNAYRAGIRGDNWDMNALDFTLEGVDEDIKLLENNKGILKGVIGKALKSRESGLQVREIYCLISENEIDVLPQSSEERLNIDVSAANAVLQDLVWIGERVCNNAAYNEFTDEDTINDYFRDMLCSKGYSEVKDQTRHGVSLSGKRSGEVDILLTKGGKEIALFEGLKLDSVNSTYIDDHIYKAINSYNALGTATFIVAYVNASNYSDFWKKYYNHISEYQYDVKIKRNIRELTSPNATTKIAQLIVSKESFDFPVYYICFKIRKN